MLEIHELLKLNAEEVNLGLRRSGKKPEGGRNEPKESLKKAIGCRRVTINSL